jgi:hypothetical protein
MYPKELDLLSRQDVLFWKFSHRDIEIAANQRTEQD